MPLTFVARLNEQASEYTDEHGDTVYLGPGMVRLVDLSDVNLKEEWNSFTGMHYAFREHVAKMLIEPDEADDIDLCDDCGAPTLGDHRWIERTETQVGECCIDGYGVCDSCGCYEPANDILSVGDEQACASCTDNYTSYCDHCDERYWDDDDADEHDHRHLCNCTPVSLEFTVPVSEGSDTTPQDTDFTVQVAYGEVSDHGIDAIRNYLMDQAIAAASATGVPYYDHGIYKAATRLWSMDRPYKNNRGTFAKRLRKATYDWTKECLAEGSEFHAYKIPADVLEKVGQIAYEHSRGIDMTCQVTRDLNQDPEDFCNEDSCWWGTDYGYSRCTLKFEGGFGLRSKSGNGCWDGRAWVLALRHNPETGEFTATRDTASADAFAVFNGYDDLEERTAPRVVSAMTGWGFSAMSTDGPWRMFVNSGSVYLVAPDEVREGKTTLYLNLSNNC